MRIKHAVGKTVELPLSCSLCAFQLTTVNCFFSIFIRTSQNSITSHQQTTRDIGGQWLQAGGQTNAGDSPPPFPKDSPSLPTEGFLPPRWSAGRSSSDANAPFNFNFVDFLWSVRTDWVWTYLAKLPRSTRPKPWPSLNRVEWAMHAVQLYTHSNQSLVQRIRGATPHVMRCSDITETKPPCWRYACTDGG